MYVRIYDVVPCIQWHVSGIRTDTTELYLCGCMVRVSYYPLRMKYSSAKSESG